ncbi:MAG: c-type cytochrome [Cephaloticoccus sp.]|nr:c-type cytochrome [Cephaloticoccus sp.]MCF7759278.1 c-type cytochrome [Cephaloticoccus sp.]
MKRQITSKLLLVALFTAAFVTSARAYDADAAQIERGRYLVQNVGMCANCHSPRGEKGMFIVGQEYTGSPLGFAPTVPMPAWAGEAPLIAGLPNYTKTQAVHFFMPGERPTGVPVRPPMPENRFNAADAKALAAYLKSLTPKS